MSLAFGLTVLTMAFAIGHISGCHLNPAVSIGLWAGGRFPADKLLPYIVAQVLGAVVAGGVLYLIASGAAGFDVAKGFASNGYGEHSPGGYSLLAALVCEVVMTMFFLLDHPGRDRLARPGRLRSDRHRAGADADPSDQHPGHQHLGQPGAQHRRGGVRRRLGGGPVVAVLARTDRRRIAGCCRLSRHRCQGLTMAGTTLTGGTSHENDRQDDDDTYLRPDRSRGSGTRAADGADGDAGRPGRPAQAQKVVQPKAGAAGTWRLIGQTHADQAADHDTIIVQGPFDNFRKIKFKVTDAPLNMQRMVVTYDNGAPDKIDIRQNIRRAAKAA